MKEFATNEEANDYVTAFGYRKKALCFVIGWDQFAPSEHTFAIDLRWNYGTILNTRIPQVEYEEST